MDVADDARRIQKNAREFKLSGKVNSGADGTSRCRLHAFNLLYGMNRARC